MSFGASWGVWRDYASSATWSLADGEGEKTVYAQYEDGAGNVSTAVSDGIRLDQTLPTGTVGINHGATHTRFETVLLVLSASDAGVLPSGVTRMRFSNDGAACSAWETYAAIRHGA